MSLPARKPAVEKAQAHDQLCSSVRSRLPVMGHSQPSTCLLRQHIIFSYFQHLSGPSLLLLAPLLSEITSNRLLASGRLLCRMDKVLLSPRADLVTESSCSLLKAHQWLSNTRVAVIWEEPLFLAVPQSGSFKEERNQPISGIFPSPLYACVCFSCTFEY